MENGHINEVRRHTDILGLKSNNLETPDEGLGQASKGSKDTERTFLFKLTAIETDYLVMKNRRDDHVVLEVI